MRERMGRVTPARTRDLVRGFDRLNGGCAANQSIAIDRLLPGESRVYRRECFCPERPTEVPDLHGLGFTRVGKARARKLNDRSDGPAVLMTEIARVCRPVTPLAVCGSSVQSGNHYLFPRFDPLHIHNHKKGKSEEAWRVHAIDSCDRRKGRRRREEHGALGDRDEHPTNHCLGGRVGRAFAPCSPQPTAEAAAAAAAASPRPAHHCGDARLGEPLLLLHDQREGRQGQRGAGGGEAVHGPGAAGRNGGRDG